MFVSPANPKIPRCKSLLIVQEGHSDYTRWVYHGEAFEDDFDNDIVAHNVEHEENDDNDLDIMCHSVNLSHAISLACRKMGTLKGYVHNKARPEGCIAKRYIDNECLSFCSVYLQDLESKVTREERNDEMEKASGELSIFSFKGRPFGGPKYTELSALELAKFIYLCSIVVIRLKTTSSREKVLIFKCEWFNLGDARGIQLDKKLRITSINVSRKWYSDQPYVLAQQVQQVFYVEDIKLGRNWYEVEKANPRNSYDILQAKHQELVEEVYQEEEPEFVLYVDLGELPSLVRDIPLVDREAMREMEETTSMTPREICIMKVGNISGYRGHVSTSKQIKYDVQRYKQRADEAKKKACETEKKACDAERKLMSWQRKLMKPKRDFLK
ncbi:protein of unknown function DUF4216 [Dillenia turbinata]|uniref:DUF4216 domain-containing protein n=1 Tax=Dillenia turbinata TaxID=194707 RepID=A0AAN8V8P4_9MAGN